ncbi:hypothetical protein ACTQ9L_03980 [Deinococcus wulumuqiensis]
MVKGRPSEPLTGFDVLAGRAMPDPAAPHPDDLAELPLPDKLREVDLTLRPDRERAVDALELAAYLEADGLNDEGLRDRYGAGGLFAAAEWLYAQRGTGRALVRPRREAPPRFPWELAQRGPLYLLPGLCGLLIAQATPPVTGRAFMFAAAFGWGYSLLIASVRYAEPLGTPGRALRLTLWLGGACGLLGGALSGLLLAGDGPGDWLWGTAMGGAVALAGSAAGVMLALGERAQVAGAFAPALLLGGMLYVVPGVELALASLAALALFPALLALRVTREPGDLPARLATLRPGLGLAAYGWALAAAFAELSLRLGGWALLPLVLSAGVLEAGVWNAQQGLHYVARQQGSFTLLVRRGAARVLGTALAYALGLLAVFALVAGVCWAWPDLLPSAGAVDPARELGRTALLTVPAFGAALLLSTWLANQRRERWLLAFWLGFGGLLVLGVSPPRLSLLAALALIPPTLLALYDLRSYR